MYKMDAKKLKARIVECGTTQEALADEIGISRATLRRRVNSGKLQVVDIHKICEALNLTREAAMDIFLSM